ncbi:hypothetical protein IscW_ISCW017285 [Ixodes scapularis]|uniref:Uncharacterized protein n=1 Tax=Ixodes scapularis TaxID=6945 RepID=B7PDI7_IXOSC|nr:hypothetical protein IscW_ISCW017285 [Ixodes scapularis]|eukprot:XP_002410831.1 hypothetical protein IscW_ISCW017285 [Ixodes scapularis]
MPNSQEGKAFTAAPLSGDRIGGEAERDENVTPREASATNNKDTALVEDHVDEVDIEGKTVKEG